jgi:acetylornithine deacetylase/succinyl-diaminopimelate desuccinylase-like protein
VTPDEILDQILIPRPNGSEGLERVAAFIAATLERAGAEVSLQPFSATPHGFQLVWSAALLLILGTSAAILLRRYGAALALTLLTASLLLVEFELLRSPVSGLLPATENNIVGSFPGRADGPTLIFCAHYDTTTHFGDHLSWGTWGWRQGPATGLAISLALVGLWRQKRGRGLPRPLTLLAAVLIPVPFAAFFWFQSVGPLVRAPSPGAIDNGGSVAALLLLSEQLASRPADAPTKVKLVFPAAEEERAMGSWAYASSLDRDAPVMVINLEAIGAADALAYVAEDGFALRRYLSPEAVIRLVNDAARDLWGAELPARELPVGTLTDARSFLAHGIPALTLRAFTEDPFPRKLHSAHDNRDRLSISALERSTRLLRALVAHADAAPSRLDDRPG